MGKLMKETKLFPIQQIVYAAAIKEEVRRLSGIQYESTEEELGEIVDWVIKNYDSDTQRMAEAIGHGGLIFCESCESVKLNSDTLRTVSALLFLVGKRLKFSLEDIEPQEEDEEEDDSNDREH